MSAFARGAGDVTHGLAFLNRHPRLWGWVIAPAIVTLLLAIALVTAVVRLVDPLVTWTTDWLPQSLEGLASTLLTVVVVIALAVGALLVFVAIVGIVAGPCNELLSEAVERRLTGEPGPRFSPGAFVGGFVRGAVHGVRRLLVALAGFVLLFALGLVPGIGAVVALALGGYLAARAAAYDCYDAVLARRELAYRDKTAFLAHHRARTLGLGAVVAALLVVPGVNLIALGLGAVGATLAARELAPARARTGPRATSRTPARRRPAGPRGATRRRRRSTGSRRPGWT